MTQPPSRPPVRVSAGLVALEGSEAQFPVWHGEPHVADPAQRQQVKEELKRAGYTPEMLTEIQVPDPGNQAHNEWHLRNPGVQH